MPDGNLSLEEISTCHFSFSRKSGISSIVSKCHGPEAESRPVGHPNSQALANLRGARRRRRAKCRNLDRHAVAAAAAAAPAVPDDTCLVHTSVSQQDSPAGSLESRNSVLAAISLAATPTRISVDVGGLMYLILQRARARTASAYCKSSLASCSITTLVSLPHYDELLSSNHAACSAASPAIRPPTRVAPSRSSAAMARRVVVVSAARYQDGLMQWPLERLVLVSWVPGCSLPFPHLLGFEADVVNLLLWTRHEQTFHRHVSLPASSAVRQARIRHHRCCCCCCCVTYVGQAGTGSGDEKSIFPLER